MEDLPPEINEQILIRLSVRDVIRCKSVCKSWKSLISDPNFIKAHLKHSYLSDHNNDGMGDRRLVISICPGFIHNYLHDIDNSFIETNHHYILGAVNGLVCVAPPSNNISVVNPSTREVTNTRKPQIPETESNCWGFGYDQLTDDYKILLAIRKGENCTCLRVFSLRSRKWKDLGEMNCVFISSVGILCKGALHWVVNDTLSKKNIILSFNVSEEKIMQIPEPDDKSYLCNVAQHSSMRLGTLKGCLCVFRHELLPNELWVMKEYNKKQSWEIYGSEREMDGMVRSLRLMKHYIQNKKPLFLDTWFGDIRMFLEACSYTESLVSPHFRKRRKRKRQESCTIKSPKVKANNDVVAPNSVHDAHTTVSSASAAASV